MSARFIQPLQVLNVLGVVSPKKENTTPKPLRITNIDTAPFYQYVRLRGWNFEANVEYNLNGAGWVAGDGGIIRPGEYSDVLIA